MREIELSNQRQHPHGKYIAAQSIDIHKVDTVGKRIRELPLTAEKAIEPVDVLHLFVKQVLALSPGNIERCRLQFGQLVALRLEL